MSLEEAYAMRPPFGFDASQSGPTPLELFGATAVWPCVLSSSAARSPAGVNVGVRCSSSAAAPATCGAEADVPAKPEAPHHENGPKVAVETLSGATRSGLIRP